MSWDSIEFPKAIRKTKLARNRQVLSSEINATGRFPVVDQGQEFIAGYSDEEHKVIRDDLPLVIFGDHTRCVKYVDFPFIIGADGTKVLKPDTELFDPKFFYYAVLGLNIPNRGYNRHFTLLKEKFLLRPERAEQRKIAAMLGLVERAIEQQERLIALTTELKKALLHKLFTEGLRGEPQKQTEIGPVPESWDTVRLGEVCVLGTGTTPPTTRPEYYDGDVPFVKTADIANNRIKISQTNVSHEAVKDCGLKLYPPGTVLMAMYGQGKTRGQVSLLEISAATSQNAAAIQPSTEINSEFLWQYLISRYQVLRGSGALGHISHLNLGYLRDFQILKPPILIQCEIAEILRTIDSRLTLIDSRKLILNDLFRTLLHQLMTAQIRVNDLDLAELSDPIEQDVDVSPCIANDRS
jgi:type I restriction enzyme S subunit